MDENNYDEFGNYIGPEIPEIYEDEDINIENDYTTNNMANEINASSSNLFSQAHNINVSNTNLQSNPNQINSLLSNINISESNYQVTGYEDKNYYADESEIYPGVQNVVMEEDTQLLTEPIIPPKLTHSFSLYETSIPSPSFSFEYLGHLSTIPSLIRNIAVAGSLHYGKTSFLDMFINGTHNNNATNYLDSRVDERQRSISIKSSPISGVLQNSSGKSYGFNVIDTPGHSNFFDEVESSFRLTDGVLIVGDIVEGVNVFIEKGLRGAMKEGLDIVLVINKIDRLITELKLPPNDAYFKIKHLIDEFNSCVIRNSMYIIGNDSEQQKKYFVHPTKNNVIFASSLYGICFTLKSYAEIYSTILNTKSKGKIHPEKGNKLGYGDIYYNPEEMKFFRTDNTSTKQPQFKRTFVEFILNPLYKGIGYSLFESKENIKTLINELNIYPDKTSKNKNAIKDRDLDLDPKPGLKLILSKYFGHYSCLVDICTKIICDSGIGNKRKLALLYNGNKNTSTYTELEASSSSGPLFVSVYKGYHSHDNLSFNAFGRILSGTLSKGELVNIGGENYSYERLENEERIVNTPINSIFFNQTRYKISINKATLGNLVLIETADISMFKNFTLVNSLLKYKDIEICKPGSFNYSYMKISVEPLNPSELPKMMDGGRKINKSYPASKTKIEESGENIILGTGELYMDCILYDGRNGYSDIEIKVSDPIVVFCETVTETSSLKCKGQSKTGENQGYMISEPLDKEIVDTMNSNNLFNDLPLIDKKEYLIQSLKWDKYTTNSIWDFSSTNILLDYSLPTETDKHSLESIRELLMQGYSWTCREGPGCNEQILNTKFKILSALISSDPGQRPSGQIISMSRRVCYSSFGTASPHGMEPILISEIQCPLDCIETVRSILTRRRGHVNSESPIPGTPFYGIKAVIPGLDSFGFETDIRTTTAGQAFCMNWFDNYGLMGGDPLDRSIVFQPGEPSSVDSLAREVMIKTRRRKGGIDEVNIENYGTDYEIEQLREDERYKTIIRNQN